MTAYWGMAKPCIATLLALTLTLGGCKRKPVPEGYRVTAYDAATKQWTIIRNETLDGRYLTKKLVVVCSFYQGWQGEPIKGPDACHLDVGRLIVPNPYPAQDYDDAFLDVEIIPGAGETLSITEHADRHMKMQQFYILKHELLTDEAVDR